MIQGQDIIVATNVNGTMQPVAASKSCDVDISQDSIEVCSPVDGRTTRKIPTRYKWGISCDCLMATNQSARYFLNAILNGNKIAVQFAMAGYKMRGDAIVDKWRVAGAKGNLTKFSVSFLGSGPLVAVGNWAYAVPTLYIGGTLVNDVLTGTGGVLTEEGVFRNH